jgi:hypothetical protein
MLARAMAVSSQPASSDNDVVGEGRVALSVEF